MIKGGDFHYFNQKINKKSMAKIGSISVLFVLCLSLISFIIIPSLSSKEPSNSSLEKSEKQQANPKNLSLEEIPKKNKESTNKTFKKPSQNSNVNNTKNKSVEKEKDISKNSSKKTNNPITGMPIKEIPKINQSITNSSKNQSNITKDKEQNKTKIIPNPLPIISPIDNTIILSKIANSIINFFTKLKTEIFRITAQLITENGTPIPNQSLYFYLDNTLLGLNITDLNGTARYTKELSGIYGEKEIGIVFLGSKNFSKANYTFKANFPKNNKTNLSLKIPLNETFFNDTNITIPFHTNQSNISLLQLPAEIGKPVGWIKKVNFNKNKINWSTEIPEESFNISAKDISKGNKKKIADEKIEIKHKGRIKKLREYELEKEIKHIKEKIINEEDKSKKQELTFKLEDLIKQNTNFSKNSDNPKNNNSRSNTSIIIKENITNLSLLYYTDAPKIIEEELGNGNKRISVSSNLHYEDVLVYTNITEIKDTKGLRLYWKEEGIYLNFTAKDTDNNSLIDKIEWIAPHLSNQTFEIILVTKAEHLDQNRNFISDIYSSVKARDNNFSEPIYSNEYVRITFEKPLTSNKDITIYAKSNNQANVEVYEKDSDVKLADFGIISKDAKYKILLENLTGIQDTFDLKIVGDNSSFVEFDYIIDPTAGFNLYWPRGLDELQTIEGGDQYIYNTNSIFTTSAKVDIKIIGMPLGVHELTRIYSNFTYDSAMVISDTICFAFVDQAAEYKKMNQPDWRFSVYEYDSEGGSTLIGQSTMIGYPAKTELTHTLTLSEPYLISAGSRIKIIVEYNKTSNDGTPADDEIKLKWADAKAGNTATWNAPAACGGTNYVATDTKNVALAFKINETFDTTPPINGVFNLSVSDGANVTRGTKVNASSSWTDNIGVTAGLTQHQGNGTLANYTTNFVDPWLNYTLNTSNQTEFSNLGLVNVSMWAQDGSDNFAQTSYHYFYLWGTSNLTSIGANETSINYSEVVNLNCSVEDVDTNLGIQNYNVSFYSNITGFLGSSLSNVNGTASLNYTFNDVGLHNVSCNITNQSDIYYFANNIKEQLTTLDVVDTVAPAVDLAGPANASFYPNVNVTFYYNVSDVSEILNCTLDLDSGATVQGNQSFVNTSETNNITLTDLSESNHAWFVDCFDIYSNLGASLTWNFTVDVTDPVANYSSPTPENNSYVTSSSISVNITHTENNTDTIVFYVDGVINQTQSYTAGVNKSTVFTKSLSNGAHNFSVFLNDSAGNNVTLETRSIIVDTAGPPVDYIAPTPTNNSNQTADNFIVNVSHTESNPDTIILYLNGAINQSQGYSGTYTNFSLNNLADGVYTYYVWLNDSAGFSNQTDTRTIRIDSTAPALSLVGPENASYDNDGTVLFEYTVTDNLIGVKNCSLYLGGLLNQTNTSVVEGVTSNFGLTLSNGNYNWSITCYDNLDNLNQSETRDITIDTTFPQISNESIDGTSFNVNQYVCLNVTVTDSFSGVSNVKVQVDKPVSGLVNYTLSTGGCGGSGPGVYSYSFLNDEAGNYTWNRTFAQDLAGNLNSSVPSSSLTWNATAVIFVNVTMTEPLADLEINESIEVGDEYNQTCSVSCRDDSTGNCTDVSLLTQYNNGSWEYITTQQKDLISNAGSYFCGNLTIGGASCNNTFIITSSNSSGGNIYPIRCIATSNNAPTDYSSEVNLTINDHPIAKFTYPPNTSWLTGTEILNASASTDDQGITTYSFEIDNNNAFTSPTALYSGSESNYTFNTSAQTQCSEDSMSCYLRLNTTDNDGLKNNTIITFGIDNTDPTVTLNAPPTMSWVGTSLAEFNYTPTDAVLDSCVLYGNFSGSWGANLTNSSPISGVINSFNLNVPDGTFIWNVFCNDSAGHGVFASSNYTLNVDAAIPNITFTTGTEDNNTYFDRDWIFVNISANDKNEANITFRLYNSSGLYSEDVFTDGTRSINWTGLNSNDFYFYNVTIVDNAGGANSTETRKITLDSTNPLISFTTGTESNGTSFNRDWIFVNVSVTETNEANITFELYNSTSLVNSTNYSTAIREINWTGLSDEDYFYNITIVDFVNRQNFTETRKITLDSSNPVVNLKFPTNNLLTNQNSLQFNYTPTDINLDSCVLYGNFSGSWLSNETNSNPISGVQNSFGPLTLGDSSYIWNLWCNDSSGNSAFNATNYTFEVDSSSPSAFDLSTPTNDTYSSDLTPLLNWSDTVEANFKNYTILVSDVINFSHTNFTYTTTGDVTNSSYQVTSSWNANQVYYWKVIAYDTLNQSTNSTSIFKYTTDTIAPVTTSVSPADAYTQTTSFSVDFIYNVTDTNPIANCSTVIDSVLGQTDTSITKGVNQTITDSLSNGVHNWNITCYDSAGNSHTSASRAITINVPVPTQFWNATYAGSTQYPYLSHTEDGTENSKARVMGATSVGLLSSASPQSGVGNNGILIPAGSSVFFSGSFAEEKAQKGYITWELYKNNGTSTLLSSFGDRNTGGLAMNGQTQTTYSNAGSNIVNEVYINGSENVTLEVWIYNSDNKGRSYTSWYDNSISYVSLDAYTIGFTNPNITAPLSDPTPDELTTFDVQCNVSCSAGDCFGTNLHLQTNESGSWVDVGASGNIILNGTQENPVAIGTVNSTISQSTNFTLYANIPSVSTLRCVSDSTYDSQNGTQLLTITVQDVTSPTITLDTPENNSYDTDGTVDFYYTPSDNVNLSSCSLYIDGTLNQTNSSINNGVQNSFLGLGFADGIYNWSITCTDTSTNVNNSETRKLTIDSTIPTSTINEPANNSFIADLTPEINFTLTNGVDLVLNYTVYVDDVVDLQGTSPNGTKTSVNLSSLTETTHRVIVEALDDAGLSANSTTLYIKVDLTYPTIDFNPSTPSNNSYLSQDYILINISAVDSNRDTVLLEFNSVNESFATSSGDNFWENKTSLSDGVYTIRAHVNDTFNQVNSTELRTITLDTANPVVNLAYPDNFSFLNSSSINFNYTPTDINLDSCVLYGNFSGSWLSNETNSNPISGVQNSFGPLTLGDSSYIWNLWCNDSSGNSAFNATNYTFFVDTVNPDVLNYGVNATQINITNSVCFNASVSDSFTNVDSVRVLLDLPSNTIDEVFLSDSVTTSCDAVNGDGIYSVDYVISEVGIYNWTDVIVNDSAGNINNTIVGITLNSTSIGTMTVNMTSPISTFEINESDSLMNYSYTQTCETICDDKPQNCTNVYLLAEYNFSGSSIIDTSSQYLRNNQDAYFCGNLTAGGAGCNFTFTINTTTDSGPNSFNLRCMANSSNVGNYFSEEIFTVTINDHPTANFTYPTNASWLTGIEILNASASTDDQGITTYSFEIDNNNAFTSPTTLYSGSESNYTFNTPAQTQCSEDSMSCYLRLNTTDNDGLKNNTIITFGIDNTGPILTLDRPINFTNITGSTYTVNASVIDSGVGNISYVVFEYRENDTESYSQACVDSDGMSPYNCSWNVGSLNDANSYEIRARANDTQGNFGSYDTHFNITIDNQGPIVNLENPINNSYSLENVTFYYNVSDPLRDVINCSLILDGSVNQTNTSIQEDVSQNFSAVGISSGSHTWRVDCYDDLSNLGQSSTRTFNIDITGPVTTVDLPASFSIINGSTYTVNASVIDSGVGNISSVVFEYRENASASYSQACVDSDGSSPFECSWGIGSLNDGHFYYLRARSNDTLGTFGNYDTQTNITIDNNNPSAFDLSTPTNDTYSSDLTPLLNWSDTVEANFKNYTILVSDVINFSHTNFTYTTTGDVTNSSYQVTSSWNANQVYYWKVIAHDTLNQSTNSTSIFKYTTDTIAPVTTSVSPADAHTQTTSFSVDFVYNVTDTNPIANCSTVIDSVLGQTDTSITKGVNQTITDSLSNGAHNWNITCYDSAGNSHTSASRAITINVPVPTQFWNSTAGADATNINLSKTEDGTENSLFNSIFAFSSEIMTTSTTPNGAGNNGMLIPAGSPFTFSGSFSANRVDVGYITWELYKDNGTQTLISSFGNQGTGGELITATTQSTYSNTGSSPSSDVYLNSTDNLVLKVYLYNNRNKQESYTHWYDNSASYVQFNAFDLGFVDSKVVNLTDPQPNETTTFQVDCNASCSNGDCFGVNVYLQTNESGSWVDVGASGNIILNGTQENPVSLGTINSTDLSFANFTLYANTPSTNYLRCSSISDYDSSNGIQLLTVTVKDITPPTISLDSPLNNSYDLDGTVDFNYTPSDNVNLSSCSLYIDEIFNQTNSSINNGVTNSFLNLSFVDGQYNWSVQCNDTSGNINNSLTYDFGVDTTAPLISYTIGTEENDSSFERNYIFVNVSVSEVNFANITFELYNSTALVNSTIYSTLVNEINWTNLGAENYSYNVSVYDLAGRNNFTQTRVLELFRDNPTVNLVYPADNANFTTHLISQFNYTVNDTSSIVNCSLYGNWSTGWHLNQTVLNPTKLVTNNFSSVNVSVDGFYIWNVVCYDPLGNRGENSTNFTFATYLPATEPILLNASQTKNDGTGNISLTWNVSDHTIKYLIYYSPNLTNFNLLGESTSPNFTDETFPGNKRRFYRVSAWNPASENFSSDYFGAHVYELKHNSNTQNWISFPTNFIYLKKANDTLNEIPNSTAFTLWNETIQKRTTCNGFSCPNFPSCTGTNCNFDIESGRGYETNINSSAPSSLNWSGVGIVYPKQSISLIKNTTDFGKNWIPIWANTSLSNALSLLSDVSNSDAITRWDNSLQTSKGYLFISAWNLYIGTNFNIEMEEAYEVSVTQNTTWIQS